MENKFKYKSYNKNKAYPFLVFDNWYTKDEENNISKELEYYRHLQKTTLNPPINNKGDVNKVRNFKYNFIDYNTTLGNNKSQILKSLSKVRSEDFHNILLENCLPYARSFSLTNGDYSLITYQETELPIKPFFDLYFWSIFIFYIPSHKKNEISDLRFLDTNQKIPVKHNRAVVFPSCYSHLSPGPLDDVGDDNGLFTIHHYYYTVPEGQIIQDDPRYIL